MFNNVSGLALAPWGVIGRGRFMTDEEEERREKSGEKGRTVLGVDWKRTPAEVKISKALEKVAKEVGTESLTAGMYLYHPGFSFCLHYTHIVNYSSGACIRAPENSICLPNYWRA